MNFSGRLSPDLSKFLKFNNSFHLFIHFAIAMRWPMINIYVREENFHAYFMFFIIQLDNGPKHL